VLIISPDRRNERASDVLVIPCSTSARAMSWHVGLQRGEAGVYRDCYVACERVTLLRKEFIDPGELGILSAGRMREVEEALLSALGFGD
jgi:mRNA-degrading endonuclease toxin of MazEF toxin-antitoxin module